MKFQCHLFVLLVAVMPALSKPSGNATSVIANKLEADECTSACQRGSGHGAGFCAASASFMVPVVNLATAT